MRQIANLLTGVFPGPRVRIPPCPPFRRAPLARAAVLLLLVGILSGCVTRRLFLVSDPPGATVILDGKEVGRTPYQEDFISYGVRRLELEMPGYARRVELLDVDNPWWQAFPIDIVTDLLLPWTIEDDRTFSFRMLAVDPEASSWDDARAAYERMREFKTENPPPADTDG